MSEHGRYLLDNQQAQAGERFDALSTLFNPSTFRHMHECGLDEGWKVWEVGAGGPSVATWLARRVGPSGYVLATDIDTSWLDGEVDGGFAVVRHDVAAEAPPDGDFDLVHARLVLVHLSERDRAIEHMIKALAQVGWLLLEEPIPVFKISCVSINSDPNRHWPIVSRRPFERSWSNAESNWILGASRSSTPSGGPCRRAV